MKNWLAYILISTFVCVTSILVMACKSTNDRLSDIFNNIKLNGHNTYYLGIVSSKDYDSLYLISELYDISYGGSLRINSSDSAAWVRITDQYLTDVKPLIKSDVFLRLLKSYLKNRDLDINITKRQALEAFKHRDYLCDEQRRRFAVELDSLTSLNDRTHQVNDTIQLTFQLSGDVYYKGVFFKKYPWSLNYNTADDTLRLGVVLLSKSLDTANVDMFGRYEMAISFKVKIIDINSNVSHYGSKLLNIGDSIQFNLADYGQKIE